MAPDRGDEAAYNEPLTAVGGQSRHPRRPSAAHHFLAVHASDGQSLTARGVLVGLAVGLIICFSNMYVRLGRTSSFAVVFVEQEPIHNTLQVLWLANRLDQQHEHARISYWVCFFQDLV